jgi:transcriptional regulator with XRE-family HTH domain
MTVKELAARAKVATSTIIRLEHGEELKPRTVDDIRAALEAAGVELVEGGGVRPRA